MEVTTNIPKYDKLEIAKLFNQNMSIQETLHELMHELFSYDRPSWDQVTGVNFVCSIKLY